ncbi:hypothetical protein [Streptomyces sp. NPDC088766]|uniref:hypothetical protein n=1 Tax=Streptomyces sp. NPDC088766 TaxID=3365893 RepID=UPI00382CEFA8
MRRPRRFSRGCWAAERIQERFLLDAPGWYGDADRVPHLAAVAAAVWARRAAVLRYRR